ncbi:late histone H1 [Klebsiella michiganensis]|uniref:late histone H1 n=1 Tax=Klebsiella michiganensis TaxID=1134687 RepID=UPI0022CE2FAB|nr:late histone H1 [Klebsiella michiganensis]
MMKKLAMALGICALMACGAASAANGQVVSKAKSACQNNATQCAQAKSTAKADAQKEAKAAKDACAKEGANKQVISSQADSLIKISRIWADFFPANTSNQPI